MPEISVIIPVYNVENYLKRCIDSVLKQSFSDFDLILVDDGSTDKSGMICDNYEKLDSRVRVIHQQNAGAAAARNAGLDFVFSQSKSNWITFIDSDDLIHPNYLKNLYSVVSEHHLDLACCKLVRVTDSSPFTETTDDSLQFISPDDFWSTDVLTATSPCAKLYAKKVLINVRFPTGKHCEDMFVLHRILFAFDRVAFCDSAMYYYFYHTYSTSNRLDTFQRIDCIDALTEQCRFFKKNHFPKSEATAAYSLFYELLSCLDSLITLYPSEKELIRIMRRRVRKVYREYCQRLSISRGNGLITYTRLAHPVYYMLRKKWKHLFGFLSRKSV